MSATTSTATTSLAATSSQAETLCLEAGPFAASELPAAEKAMSAASMPAGSWTRVSSQRKGSYLIYMGRYADAEALSRKQAELQRLKVESRPMADWPDLQPGLVLGRFESKAAADGALAGLVRRGVKTGRVVTLTPSVTVAALRVPAATAEQRSLLAGLKLPPGRIGFGPCPSEAGKA